MVIGVGGGGWEVGYDEIRGKGVVREKVRIGWRDWGVGGGGVRGEWNG